MTSVYREFAPAPHLAGSVECFWTLDVLVNGCKRVLPDGCTDVLFFSRDHDLVTAQVVGAMTRPRDVPLVAGQSFLGVRFRPGMAGAWLRIDGQALTDQIRPFCDALGTAASDLVDRIAKVDSVEERISLLEARLARGPAMTAMQQAIGELVRSKGQLPIAEFAELAEVSPRQLRRTCLSQVGLSPKQLARILRFRNAVTVLREGATGMAGLALDCGYFDQAHMIRDFRELAGTSPVRYTRNHIR